MYEFTVQISNSGETRTEAYTVKRDNWLDALEAVMDSHRWAMFGKVTHQNGKPFTKTIHI